MTKINMTKIQYDKNRWMILTDRYEMDRWIQMDTDGYNMRRTIRSNVGRCSKMLKKIGCGFTEFKSVENRPETGWKHVDSSWKVSKTV